MATRRNQDDRPDTAENRIGSTRAEGEENVERAIKKLASPIERHMARRGRNPGERVTYADLLELERDQDVVFGKRKKAE